MRLVKQHLQSFINPQPSLNKIKFRIGNINLLTQFCCSDKYLSIAPWWVLSSFLACLSLWQVNEKVRNRWRAADKLYSFYLLRHANGQTHVCLIASSVKIIIKRVAVIYWFKSARMVSCWDLYACYWAVISQYSWCYQAIMTIMIDWKIMIDCKIISSCTDSHHRIQNM